MKHPIYDLIGFLARYSIYLVIPGFWFAYIAGIKLWIGGTAGLFACLLLAIPLLICSHRKPVTAKNRCSEMLKGES